MFTNEGNEAVGYYIDRFFHHLYVWAYSKWLCHKATALTK